MTQVKRYSDTAGTNLVGKTINTIDDAGRVTNIDHQNGSGTTRDKFDYQYDNADRVTQEISTLGGTRNYGYDAEGQLTSDETGSYSYDLAGNRNMAGYVTGAGNRLSTEGTWNFTYNDEGNQTQKVKISTTEMWNYFYNHRNQLTKVEKKPTSSSSIDLRVEYKYDVLGNRIEKSVDADGDGPGTATVTRFAYDGFGNAWADMDTAGNVLTRRLYKDAADAYFARYSSTNQLDWVLEDRLVSVRDWMDNSGVVQDHIDYSGFGKITSETNSSYADRYKWTSRERDTENNLQYNRARYYDYETGRWISEDPLGFDAGDSNLFRYVNNGPTLSTDPSGLHPTPGLYRGRSPWATPSAADLYEWQNSPLVRKSYPKGTELYDHLLRAAKQRNIPTYMIDELKALGTVTFSASEYPTAKFNLIGGLFASKLTSNIEINKATYDELLKGAKSSLSIGLVYNEIFHAFYHHIIKHERRAQWVQDLMWKGAREAYIDPMLNLFLDSAVRHGQHMLEEAMSEMVQFLTSDLARPPGQRIAPILRQKAFGTPSHTESGPWSREPFKKFAETPVPEYIRDLTLWLMQHGLKHPHPDGTEQQIIAALRGNWNDSFKKK